MEVFINDLKTRGFVIDDKGELKTPMYFENSDDISHHAKSVFKTIAEYCLKNECQKIGAMPFREIIENNHLLSYKTLAALTELKNNDFIELNIWKKKLVAQT